MHLICEKHQFLAKIKTKKNYLLEIKMHDQNIRCEKSLKFYSKEKQMCRDHKILGKNDITKQKSDFFEFDSISTFQFSLVNFYRFFSASSRLYFNPIDATSSSA